LDIAFQILKEVRPDIYQSQPRSRLEKLANGKALEELQTEIERIKEELKHTKQELSQFQCPFCQAPIIEQIPIPLDPLQKDWDTREVYQCGHEVIAGQTRRPCPSDPSFPKLSEYEFRTEYYPEPGCWYCRLEPKTQGARLLSFDWVVGRTEDEAKQMMVEQYQSRARKWGE
jgi:hypothetical protein